eukprot:TRINITY_DN8429_c0_g1_i3.p1 TRINITY_DN8429_c0_g1~~TRINITY_DN8429_c0_g1_i3.p1  ORF type:complete len:283 (-),score=17.29 TRINITY_DN8429_c0_g1_i3:301-1149(-)
MNSVVKTGGGLPAGVPDLSAELHVCPVARRKLLLTWVRVRHLLETNRAVGLDNTVSMLCTIDEHLFEHIVLLAWPAISSPPFAAPELIRDSPLILGEDSYYEDACIHEAQYMCSVPAAAGSAVQHQQALSHYMLHFMPGGTVFGDAPHQTPLPSTPTTLSCLRSWWATGDFVDNYDFDSGELKPLPSRCGFPHCLVGMFQHAPYSPPTDSRIFNQTQDRLFGGISALREGVLQVRDWTTCEWPTPGWYSDFLGDRMHSGVYIWTIGNIQSGVIVVLLQCTTP